MWYSPHRPAENDGFMKKKEYLAELKELSAEALQERISDLQEELMNLRFKHASGQLEKSSELASLRKKIAQAKTIINETLNVA